MRGNFGIGRVWANLSTAGALLACVAVLLNFGDLGNAGKRSAAHSTTPQHVTSWITWEKSAEYPPAEKQEKIAYEIDSVFPPLMAPLPGPNLEVSSAPADQLHKIVGIWSPDANACLAQNFRDGLLPTIISANGAWAGETFCTFKNQKQTETGWKVSASCSSGHERWTTIVRLTIKGDRLIWASKRGTQAYTRCAPDFRIAEAP